MVTMDNLEFMRLQNERAKMLIGKLNALENVGDIVNFFELRGIKGYRSDEDSCPISTWLNDQLECAVTTNDQIRVWVGGGYYGEDCEVFEVSDTVKDFIDNFDNGLYPSIDADYDPEADFDEDAYPGDGLL